MKKLPFCHDTGLLIVRIVLAGIFLYHGLGKIGASPEVMWFVGGAGHALGLTFISTTVWYYIALGFELIGAALILFGAWTRVGATMLFLIMIGAMNVKGWAWPKIELDVILAALSVAIFVAGPGKLSLCQGCCAKDGVCNGNGCKK